MSHLKGKGMGSGELAEPVPLWEGFLCIEVALYSLPACLQLMYRNRDAGAAQRRVVAVAPSGISLE